MTEQVAAPAETSRGRGVGVWAGVAAATSSVLFGGSLVATRYVIPESEPGTLVFIRYLVASLCLVPLALWTRRERVPPRDLLRLAGLGVVFFGVFPLTLTAALQYVPASQGALAIGAIPVFTLLLAAATRSEHLSRAKAGGVALAFAGILLAEGAPLATADVRAIGIALLLIAALCAAVFSVFSRSLLRRYSALLVTAYAMVAGTLFVLPFAVAEGILSTTPKLSPTAWVVVVLVLGVMTSAGAMLLYGWALERTTPTAVAIFVPLNPLTAAALGRVLLGETLSPRFLAGFACVILGAALVVAYRAKG